MPLFWLALAFLTGLVLGWGQVFAWEVLAGAACLCAGLAIFERRLLGRFAAYTRLRSLVRLPLAVLLAALALGGLRQALAHPPLTPADLAWYNTQTSTTFRIQGLVSTPPGTGQHPDLYIEARSITPLNGSGLAAIQPTPIRGRLLVSGAIGPAFRYGDLVELDGTLVSMASSPQSQAAQESLARQGILSIMNFPQGRLVQHDAGNPFLAWLYDLRQQARLTINSILPAPESALLTGILLGINTDLPDEVAAAFQATGTAHIWAISGFNIAIVSGLLVTLLGRLLPRRRLLASLLAIGTVSAYTLLVGANPSVVRAAIMGTVGMFGPLLGRRQNGLNSLTFTAAAMCLFDPSLPWNISFQLSFAATLGLVGFGDRLQSGLEGLLQRRLSPAWARKVTGPVAEYFLLTLAAQMTTLPVTAIHFQRFSLSAVLANPLVLPVQSLVMVLGGLALLGGLVFVPLGQALAALDWPLLAYTMRMVELLAKIPGGMVLGAMDQVLGAAWYGGLLVAGLGMYRANFFKRWLSPAAAIIGVALLAGVTWRAALAAPDGRLHLTAFNDAGLAVVLVQSGDGRSVLLNGGTDETRLLDVLGRRLAPFEAHLDGWLVTSRTPSSLGAAQTLLGRYPPSQAVISDQLPASKARDAAVAALKEARVELYAFQPGQQVDLGQGASLQVLADTQAGTALLLEWKNFRVLLPGGAALKDLDRSRLGDLTALVLGPADLENTPAADWQTLAPRLVIWQQAGAVINEAGWVGLESCSWVELSSDGQQLWPEIEK